MPLLGAHMSIAGGYYKAVRAAADFEMDCVQLFTKNNNQWRAKPLTDNDIRLFRQALDDTGIQAPLAHDSYLINLASPDDALWQKSLDSFIIELQRAEALGLIGVVMHPGSFVSSTEEEGLQRIVRAIDTAHRKTPKFRAQILLETTAGQGTNLGWRFEHLAYILGECAESERLGVCVDTCHLHAAGYPLWPKAKYNATWAEFEQQIGIDRIRAFHLNDSKRELGSRVDRHEHIGHGHIGVDAFRLVLNDPRFRHLPMYLETAKEEHEGEHWDAINMRTLRGLVKAPRRSAKTRAAKK